jgi:AcrR family transcriptional regulator
VQGVSRRAGVTTGALYALFGSKQGLLLALLDERDQLMGGPDAAAVVSPAMSLPEAVSAVAAAYEKAVRSSRALPGLLLELELIGIAARDPAMRAWLAAQGQQARAALADLLVGREVAPGRRTTPEQAAHVAAALTALLQGLCQHAVLAPDLVPPGLFSSAAVALTHLPDHGRGARP